jgi:GDP-mannose 6-dehydrogenase
LSNESGAETFVLDAIIRSNDAHKRFICELAAKNLKPGAKILLNGLSFKADSDDLRESPYVDLARRLLTAGFDLRIWDPQLNPASLTGQNLGYSFTYLPEMHNILLQDRDSLNAEGFAAVIDTRGNASELQIANAPIVSVNAIA